MDSCERHELLNCGSCKAPLKPRKIRRGPCQACSGTGKTPVVGGPCTVCRGLMFAGGLEDGPDTSGTTHVNPVEVLAGEYLSGARCTLCDQERDRYRRCACDRDQHIGEVTGELVAWHRAHPPKGRGNRPEPVLAATMYQEARKCGLAPVDAGYRAAMAAVLAPPE